MIDRTLTPRSKVRNSTRS